jgi:hypothetical protein
VPRIGVAASGTPDPVAPRHTNIPLVNSEGEAIREGVDVRGDRADRPGVMFKDADRIGIPVRVIIGPGAPDRGGV